MLLNQSSSFHNLYFTDYSEENMQEFLYPKIKVPIFEKQKGFLSCNQFFYHFKVIKNESFL